MPSALHDLPFHNLPLGPLLVRADNFTPATRTPWGGTQICGHYKAALDVASGPGGRSVGESWEVSVEPDFPSRVDPGDELLSDVLARDPAGWLGAEARVLGRTSTALLVKLLDAAADLSVQIHPADDYAGLAPDECGKPESWYVLDADPGAGLYVGLRAGVDAAAMARALASGALVDRLLTFVPVVPGDFFVIEAGTPHAIGRGVTLIEPQQVTPGRRGVTYRYWDWNRRYDKAGRIDPNGVPRALHESRALDVTSWGPQRGDALLERIRVRAGAPDVAGAARATALSGLRGAAIASQYLDVTRIAGTGALALGRHDGVRALTVVAGEVRVRSSAGELAVPMGRSAVLPAALVDATLELEHAHAVVAGVSVCR